MIQLDKQGLVVDNQQLAWSEISDIQGNDDVLAIFVNGEYQPRFTIAVDSMPNPFRWGEVVFHQDPRKFAHFDESLESAELIQEEKAYNRQRMRIWTWLIIAIIIVGFLVLYKAING